MIENNQILKLTDELNSSLWHVGRRSEVSIDEVDGQVEGLPVKPVHLANLNLNIFFIS